MNLPDRMSRVLTSTVLINALPSGKLTALLVWCSLTVLCSLYATIPLLPAFSAQFGAPLTAVAWTGSAFSLGYIAGCVIFGALAERYGTRAVILAGMCVLAAVTPLVGFANSLASLVALRAVQGAAAASFAPAALAYVALVYAERSKLRALGYITTALLSAGVVGQLIGGAVANTWQWPAVFYLLAAVYLLNALLIGRWMQRTGKAGDPDTSAVIRPLRFYPKLGERILASANNNPKPLTAVRTSDITRTKRLQSQYIAVLNRRSLYPPFAITATVLFAFVAMYTLLGIKLSALEFGLTASDILLVRAFGLIGILLSPLSGKLIARIGHANVLRFNLTLCIAGLLATGLSDSLGVIVPLSVVFVAGIALTTPALISLISRLAGDVAALAINVYSLILFVGATIGPVAAVYAAELAGTATAFAMLALTLAGAFVCTFAIKIRR